MKHLKNIGSKIIFACMLIAVLASSLIGCAVKEKGPDFKKLYDEIDSDVKYSWKLGSDGSYLSADTNVYNLDDYTNFAILYSIRDMNKKLGLPESLYEDMLGTNSLMGKQQETFEDAGVKVSWSYHPDNGMEVTYKLLDN